MSKGDQVLGPSLAKANESGRSRRRVLRVVGVRVRRAIVSGRLWGMGGLDSWVRILLRMGL
jgi:hypothetical protein